MGTWGAGNFDSDDAREYLDSVMKQMVSLIENYLGTKPTQECDFDALEGKLLPSVDILITLSKHYQEPLNVELKTVQQWRKRILVIYDETIDTLDPKDDFKIDKRRTVEDTFQELEELAREWDSI
jgi:hypothetical protein